MSESRAAIVEQGLRELLKPGGHFSICQLEALIKLAETVPPPGVLEELRVLHCVNYRDMTTAVREALPGLVESCFSDRWLSVQVFPADLDESKPRLVVKTPRRLKA